jgi:hypothetical protein
MQIRQSAIGAAPQCADSSACPYAPQKQDYCSASVMLVSITDRARDHYCGSEDFDRCPLFLAKVLRGRS